VSTPGADPLLEAVAVMARIRAEGDWESAQTHASLLPYLVEESWELVDAVDAGDRAELRSELGDLLLQVLFHSAIAAEHPTDPFDVRDVARALLDKLRRRAPYWFTEAGTEGLDAREQDRLWQEAKRAEGAAPRGVVEGIAWDQPALALGQKVLERARAAGFPDELVPPEVTTVRVAAGGVFAPGSGGSGSAEVGYRSAVRAFARRLAAAEERLGGDRSPASWRAAWDGTH